MSSILFGDSMVPTIEYDSILLLGYSSLSKGIRDIILLGSTTKKHYSDGCREYFAVASVEVWNGTMWIVNRTLHPAQPVK